MHVISGKFTHLLYPNLELLILSETEVRGKHHEGLVIVIHARCAGRPLPWGTFPAEITLLPLELQEQLEVLVAKACWVVNPSTLEATSIRVASTQIVSTTESNNLLVIESHAVEDVSQVVLCLSTIWKTSTRRKQRVVFEVAAPWFPWNVWSTHTFNRDDAGQSPH